jgi:hypothetical protein
MRILALLVPVLVLGACSGGNSAPIVIDATPPADALALPTCAPDPGPCTFTFSGIYSGTATCGAGVVVHGSVYEFQIILPPTNADIQNSVADFTFSAMPTVGTYTGSNVTDYHVGFYILNPLLGWVESFKADGHSTVSLNLTALPPPQPDGAVYVTGTLTAAIQTSSGDVLDVCGYFL